MSKTHGASEERLYFVWTEMKQRCENPKNDSFVNYGARGISVHPTWSESYEAFRDYMGPRPPGMTVERIDNNGNYQPGNVRWATRAEQNSNRRNVRLIEFAGETLSVKAWSRRLGLSPEAVRVRLRRGWPIERALTPKARAQ